jgi:hypothetical protein
MRPVLHYPRMRLFIGIPLPGEVAEELTRAASFGRSLCCRFSLGHNVPPVVRFLSAADARMGTGCRRAPGNLRSEPQREKESVFTNCIACLQRCRTFAHRGGHFPLQPKNSISRLRSASSRSRCCDGHRGTRWSSESRAFVRPIVFIGLVSYSWYLWHWPMLSFARIVLAERVSESVGVSIALVSLIFAVLSYRFIEQPFRASTTVVPLLLKRYAAALAVVMLPAAVFCAADGLPQRNRAAQAFETADKHLEMAECLASASDAHPLLHPPCVPPGQGRAVALIGDSHAAVLASALRSISERAGYRLIEITDEGCPALEGAVPVFSYDPGFSQECPRFNREAQDYINRNASIQVVVIAAYWSKLIEEIGIKGTRSADAR